MAGEPSLIGYLTPDPLTQLREALDELGTPCELVLPTGRVSSFGRGPAEFRIVLRNELPLRQPITDWSLARAYVNGDIDVEGDVIAALDLRDRLAFAVPVGQLLRLAADLLLPATVANTRAIDFHYSLGDDFYLTFLDSKYHFYSQCRFQSEDETLEQAAEHKLESMWSALDVQPGMRLLDIGGGWGGLAAYAGPRGVHVTSLTINNDSAEYMRRRIESERLPAEVRVEDILDHYPSEPYDHVVIFGVIEHVPNYRRFCQRVWGALAPGGRLYVDASATREKYATTAFTREYTWHGPHSCLIVQDLLEELLYHGFDVLNVRQDTHDYELTMRRWAERFDDAHPEVADRWTEEVYRAFRVFLWGGVHGFRTNRLQAYTVVAERREDAGPRPGNLRRLGHFVASAVSR
jgi:cyclopropane-fatty-acyl-phospholipid synthase